MPEPEWVSSLEAISALGESVAPVESRQAQALCRRARFGLVRTRAAEFGWNHFPEKDVELPRDFWWAEGKGGLKQDWFFGDFSTYMEGRTYLAFGVQFCKQDVEQMGGIFRDNPLEAPNRGGRPRSADWADFVAELCAHIHYVGIPDGYGTEGTEKVIEEVTTSLMQRGVERTVSRSTAQPIVNATLLRLRSEAEK